MDNPLGGTTIRLARNGSALFGARVASAAAGTVVLPVLYARLGPRAFGIWVLLAGLVSIAGYADVGLASAQSRWVAGATGARTTFEGGVRARAVLTVGVSWGVGVAVLCVVAAATSWWAEPPLAMFGQLNEQAWRCLLVLLMAIGMCSLVTPWRAVLVGVQRYTVIAFADVAVGLTTSFLSVVVVLAGGGIVTLAVCVCAVNAGQAVALMVLARACAPTFHPSFRLVRWHDVKTTFRYGVPVQVTSAASAANGEAARLVLGGMGGPAVVAGFEPGNRLAHLLHVPMAPFLMAMFPVASAAAICSDTAKVDRLYLGMTRYLAVFGSVSAAALGAAADPLIRLWLGHPVPLAAVTLALLSAAYAVNLAAGPASIVSRAEGRPGRETRYALSLGVLQVGLCFSLFHFLGPWGVPLATLLAMLVATTYFLARFHRSSGRPLMPLMHALWPPVTAAAGAALAAVLLLGWVAGTGGRVDAAVAAGARMALVVVVATVTLLLIGYFDAVDRSRLREVVTSLRGRRVRVAAVVDADTAMTETYEVKS